MIYADPYEVDPTEPLRPRAEVLQALATDADNAADTDEDPS